MYLYSGHLIKTPLKTKTPPIPTTQTQDTIIHVTTLPHRGRVGPPPPKGVATTFNTATTKETKPPNPPPVGKAGFEVWVLTKGGLVSVHHCRLYRTVVHAHHVRVCTSGPRVRACIGMVRSPKAKLSYSHVSQHNILVTYYSSFSHSRYVARQTALTLMIMSHDS